MNKYELTCLVSGDVAEEELKQIQEKIKKSLGGAKIIGEKVWGKRKLAYPIKKERQAAKSDFGYYVSLNFEIEPAEIRKIDSEIKTKENVLRHLMVMMPKEIEKPKEVKKVKEEVVEKEKKVEKAKIKPQEKEETKPPALLKPRGVSKKAAPKKAKPEKIKARMPKIEKPVKAKLEPVEEKMKELDEKLEEILKE